MRIVLLSALIAAVLPLPSRAEAPKPLKRVDVKRDVGGPSLPANDRRIDGVDLEQARVTELSELQAQVPNLRIADYGSRAGQRVVGLRGFMNHWSSPQAPVALRIDGVTLADPLSFDQRLFDVDRVDVRVGPQGTQGSTQAPAGMIDVVTRRPDGFRAWLESGLSSRDGYSVGTGVGGDIGEHWQGSIAVLADRSDGFLHNLARPDAADARRDRYLRGRLWWQPDDDTELRLLLLDRHANDDSGEVFVPVDTVSFNALPTLAGLQLGDFDRALDQPGFSRVDATLAGIGGHRVLGALRIGGELSSRRSQLASSSDYDLSPQPWFVMDSDYDTQESRAELFVESSPESEVWRWRIGAAAVDREFDTRRVFNAGPGNPWQLPVMGYVRTDVQLSDDDRAMFGEASRRLDASGRWRLGAGARLQWSGRRMHFGGSALGAPVADLRHDDRQQQPRLWLEFSPDEGMNAYAALARGGRPAGFNPGTFSAAQSAYRAETMTALDVGLRGGQDKPLEWQVAVFSDRVRDYQELTFADREFTTYLRNVERVDLHGGEASVQVRVGDRWRIGAKLGHVRARYGRDRLDPMTGFGLSGRRLSQVPANTARTDIEYRTGPWFVRGEWVAAGGFRIDAYDAQLAELREENIRGFRIVNASAGWRGEHWSLLAQANNLGDERYFTGATFGFAALALYPRAIGTPAPPRTFGLAVRWDN